MRDPYPLARLSGIVALANTDRFYTLRDIASKVLPSLCMLTIDPEKDVRDEAFKTIKLFTQKLEKVSEKPELAMELEKDVTSCTLDLKNETSWTSWAMGSLSAKVTGYKAKPQQPSVALNTQPLAAPTSMTKEAKQQTPEKQQNDVKESNNSGKTPMKVETVAKPPVVSDNFNAGWGDVDDEEWKDLDDDNDQMQPLEPSVLSPEPFSSPKIQPLPTDGKSTGVSDWSEDWASSFEQTEKIKPAAKINVKKGPPVLSSSSNDKSSLKPASAYNWSNSNTGSRNNEEDLFASLVKDVKLTNKVRVRGHF
jgi:hypothetical protein